MFQYDGFRSFLSSVARSPISSTLTCELDAVSICSILPLGQRLESFLNSQMLGTECSAPHVSFPTSNERSPEEGRPLDRMGISGLGLKFGFCSLNCLTLPLVWDSSAAR